MAAPLTPTGINVQGNIKHAFVPALSLTAPSLAAAIAVGALDVSNILYADGWALSIESNKNTAPRRIGTKKVWETLGTTKESLGTMKYVVSPQAVAASDGKKAWEKFPDGTTGFMLERLGLDVDTDLAVGQFVRVIPVKFGSRNITGDPTDEAAEFAVEQAVIVTAPGVGDLVALVA